MALFKDLVLHFLPLECYEEFFLKFNFLHVPCLKAALSKGLGFGIIAGSMLVKVPQITKIFNAKSAEGINFQSVLLDLMAISWNVAYAFQNKFPFSAWGEGLFLALQTLIIGALVLLYNDKKIASIAFIVFYSLGLYILMGGYTPMGVLWSLQASIIPILIVSKLIQTIENFRNGSTGQLSAVTVFLLFAGSLARIFTSIQETNDPLMIITYVVTSVLNGIIATQMIYYWNVKHVTKKQKQKLANKKKS